jgi:hypothetical protein
LPKVAGIVFQIHRFLADNIYTLQTGIQSHPQCQPWQTVLYVYKEVSSVRAMIVQLFCVDSDFQAPRMPVPLCYLDIPKSYFKYSVSRFLLAL